MKIRVHLRRKIPLEHILFSIAMFCVVTYALLEHVSTPIPVFSSVKFPLLYLGGLCILPQVPRVFRVMLKRKYFYVLLMLVAFCLTVYLSAYFNRTPEVGINPKDYSNRLILYLVELFLLMIWVAETGRSKTVINFLFYYLLVVTLISDFLMFTQLITFSSGNYTCFLVGTKFIVVYFHFNLLAIWLLRCNERMVSNQKRRAITIWGIIFVAFISIYVDCMTGIFGCLLMILMLGHLRSPGRKRIVKLHSPGLMQLVMSATVLFPFIASTIVSVPVVQQILTDVFNRSKDLTGRMNIYTQFADVMTGHWLIGFGVGNANAASVRMFGYANAQNGLLQWVLQIGVPGTVLMVALMAVIIGRLNKSESGVRSLPLVCLVYMYIILGMIEITYSMSFLLWFGIIFMLSADNPTAVTQQEIVDGA